jgi:hypothetical protein
MNHVRAFIAGFLATLIFHQGLLGLLYLAGVAPAPPFNLGPTAPLGVPAVLSLAFWGGVWGVALWAVLSRFRGAVHWALAIGLGAIGPSAVALLLVFPLKGLAVNATIVVGALLLNGFWGLGLALIMRVLGGPGQRAPA